MKGIKQVVIGLSALGLLTLLSAQAFASGYKLEFQSTSTLADAGDAAVVEDAGTNWYNSAGLVDLPHQYVASGIGIYQSTTFNGSTTSAGGTGGVPVPGSPGSANSSPHPFLPAIHYTHPFGPNLAVGFSLVPAWGLQEFYGNNDSILRYDLVRVYTKTIDFAPSIAFRFNNQWSFGLGPDLNYFQILGKSNSALPIPGVIGDGIARYSAEQWKPSFHVGALYKLSPTTRFGLNYRSRVMMNLRGFSSFVANGGAVNGMNESNQFTLSFPLPATTTFSAYHDMNPVWSVMGTIAWDQWSVLKNYIGTNYAQPVGFVPSTVTVILPQNMHDTVDLSIGTRYKVCDQLMLRASFKYEPSPTNNAYRDVTNPDAPKYGINLGARYTMNQKFAFDFLYAHVFTPTVSINGMNPLTGSTATGNVRTRMDLVGAQLVWSI